MVRPEATQPAAYASDAQEAAADIPYEDGGVIRPGGHYHESRPQDPLNRPPLRVKVIGTLGAPVVAEAATQPATDERLEAAATTPPAPRASTELPVRIPEAAVEVVVEPDPDLGPPLDEVLAAEQRSTILGDPKLSRFLSRQVLSESARQAVRVAGEEDRAALAYGEPLAAPKLVMNVNFGPRKPEPQGYNLGLTPDQVKVVDAGVFEPGGAVERMGPSERIDTLARVTAGDDPTMRREHRNLLRLAEDTISTKVQLSDGTVLITDRPSLAELTDVIGLFDNGRIGSDYADSPVHLDADKVAAVQEAFNGARFEAANDSTALRRLRAALDDIAEYIARPLPHAEEPPSNSTEIVPRVRHPGLPPVIASRLNVRPDSSGDFLTDEVIGLGQVTLAVAKNGNGNTVPRLILEKAERLVAAAPDLFAEILEAASEAVPPIPVTVTFGQGVDEKNKQYLSGSKTVLTPRDNTQAQMIAPHLPARPMQDLQSVSDSTGSTDGVSTGQSTTRGQDPDKTLENGGTSASGTGALGLSANYTETKNVTVRPPYAHELEDCLDEWQGVHYPVGSQTSKVYDLRNRGLPIRASLQAENKDKGLGTREEIARVGTEMKDMRAQNKRGDGLTAALPPHPNPPVQSKARERIDKLHPWAQVQELSIQMGYYGTVNHEVVREAMGIWSSQAKIAQTASPEVLRQHWMGWCRERNVPVKDARAVWKEQHARAH